MPQLNRLAWLKQRLEKPDCRSYSCSNFRKIGRAIVGSSRFKIGLSILFAMTLVAEPVSAVQSGSGLATQTRQQDIQDLQSFTAPTKITNSTAELSFPRTRSSESIQSNGEDFKRIRLNHVTATQAEEHLRSRLRTATDLKILIDPTATADIVLYGSQENIQHGVGLINEMDRPRVVNRLHSNHSTRADNLNSSRRPEFASDDHRDVPKESYQISNRNDSTEWYQVNLESVSLTDLYRWINQFPSTQIKSTRLPDGMLFELVARNGKTLRFGWDWDEPIINLGGSTKMIQQFAQMIDNLETAHRQRMPSDIVSYQNASPVKVNRLVGYWTSAPSNSLASRPQVSGLNAVNTGSFNQGGLPTQSLTGSVNQDQVLPGIDPLSTQEIDDPNQDQIDRLRQLNESIQVEVLPDLGVIILRGRQNEVQELSRVLRELERLSAETQPEVQIVPLRFVQSDAIESIIASTSADLISGRVGKVSITSLVKPNALLLIGWGDAVEAILDLIQKLDQPVAAESQFEVFRLQQAEATQVQTSLNAFFQNRGGLGVRIQAIADARTNSLIVFSSPRDRNEVRRLIEELDVPGFQVKRQARVVKIRNAIASELAVTLRAAIQASASGGPDGIPFLELLGSDIDGNRLINAGSLEDVQITANPVNNSLILTGAPGSVDVLESMIAQLDVAGASAQIKVFRIEYGDATTLVQVLRSLLPEQSIDRPALKIPSDSEESSLAPLRFSVDTRTNSIIATGSEGDLKIIHALILRLDEKEFSQRQNMVYRLKNAPAVDVANAINNFLRSERVVQQIGGGLVSPFEQLEREVIVVPEPIGNRLILSATPRFFDEVEALINQLDEPPPQVMIQVMIAEITLNQGHEFGIEIGLQDSVLFDRSLLGNLLTTTESTQTSTPGGVVTATEQIIQAATNAPGFEFNNQPLGNSGSNQALARSNVIGTQGLSNFSLGRVNSELGFGGMVFSANSESVSVLVRALQESRRLEILSRPQIRTLDNQPAFIQVGQRVPRIVGSTVNQAGQSNSVVLENVGLILGVTPRISPDGTVVMEIDAERSGLGPEAEGVPVSVSPTGEIIRSPRVDTTTAQATVSAGSGETIILGGLITKQTETIERKVPRLGDIPVLGRLFRFDREFTRRTELLIILTPYVIRNRLDELKLQQEEFARMSWCLADVEEIHGHLEGIISSNMFDYDSSETMEFLPGQSPLDADIVQPIQPVPRLQRGASLEFEGGDK